MDAILKNLRRLAQKWMTREWIEREHVEVVDFKEMAGWMRWYRCSEDVRVGWSAVFELLR